MRRKTSTGERRRMTEQEQDQAARAAEPGGAGKRKHASVAAKGSLWRGKPRKKAQRARTRS